MLAAVTLNCSCRNAIQRDCHGDEDSGNQHSASLQGETITLRPSGAIFKIPADWIEWQKKYGNANLHLERKEIDAIAEGEGEWDTEFAKVCNAVLPIDHCSAHVGEEGWGRAGVAYSDLQVRVYELDDSLDAIDRRIKEKGRAAIKAFSEKEPVLLENKNADWRQTILSFDRFYEDYGATAHIDFRVQQFDKGTIAFVFMYTSFQSQNAEIESILNSFESSDLRQGVRNH
jgi:hypothetical protein